MAAAEPVPEQDIVDRFVELLRTWSPQTAELLGDKGLQEFGELLRHEFAGEEVYISKVSKTRRQALLTQVDTMLQARVNVTQIARVTGLSRGEVYRRRQRMQNGITRLSQFSGK